MGPLRGSEGTLMEWTHILAYITGAVDQELLLRNEYLADTDPAPAILFADHLAHKHGTCGPFRRPSPPLNGEKPLI